MKNCTYVLRAVLCVCLIAAGIVPGYSQQIEKGIRVSNGDYLGFLEYKPEDYAIKTTTKYPLIIFLHGIGERGNGTTELQKVSCCGLPRIIKRGHNMKFTWNGKTESFIVLSPQCPKSYGMWPNLFIEELIAYAKNNLRVDPNRIFLTGLSMGGGGTFKYISTAAEQPKNLAAAATICAPCTFKEAKYVVDAKLPTWFFHAADDAIALASCTESAVRKINALNPAVKPIKTIWPTGGHVVWDRVYTDTNYRFQGIVNIYEWFLGQNKSLPANKLPVANAGNTINITTGTGIATLNASASSDVDGKIVRYVWKKIEGPAAGVITNHFGPNSSTTVTGLTVAGTYKYELNVVDDRAAFTSDTVIVNVASGVAIENKAPLAKAGTDITITLPTNSVKLDGTASTDADGSIASYVWTKVSGPTASIATPNTAATSVNDLIEGTYVFKLTVTDNKGAKSEDQVSVIVKPAPVVPNVAPVAAAGRDITITLPVSRVTLDGAASYDEDGSIVTYSWTKTGGPAATVVSPNASATAVNNLTEGNYVFRLRITDNKGATDDDYVTVVVKPAPNSLPAANAGSDIVITLPDNKATLDGSASADADGTLAAYEWTILSGPSQYIIVNATAATTDVTNLTEGTYKFRLHVTDDKGAIDADTVLVKVNPAAPLPNVAPVAEAGADETISLPLDNVNLDGSASYDPDGSINTYSWSYLSGPESFVIAAPQSSKTSVSGLVAGTYTFKFKIKDNDGALDADTVIVVVRQAELPPPPPNKEPVATAGQDQTITLPVNEVTVDGSLSNDEDGTLTNYSWLKISGPSQFNIVSPSYHITKIENLVEGTYAFRLQVKDNDGALGFDTIIVKVLRAPNVVPVSKAGADIKIQLPKNNVELNGMDSYDPDGSISGYFWESISGPSTVTIASSSSMKTTVTGFAEGDYKFRLTVTDNEGKSASDVVLVSVSPEVVKLIPIAKAGADIQVRMPEPSIKLNGTDSYDPDGSIESFSWVKVSGPGGVTIINSTGATPSIMGVSAGEYVFRLTIKDNDGLAASDVVNVTVLPEPVSTINENPVAVAGQDQSISYPASVVAVDGNASRDNDGSIAAYQWNMLSGPVQPSIAQPTSSSTNISNLQTGEYVFELVVTDDKGAISRDTMHVSVINTMRYEEALVLYPNPARSNINVQLTSDTMGVAKISIYNASGVLVSGTNTNKTQAQLFKNINISNLQTGLYYLEVIADGKQRKISKFIKQQ